MSIWRTQNLVVDTTALSQATYRNTTAKRGFLGHKSLLLSPHYTSIHPLPTGATMDHYSSIHIFPLTKHDTVLARIDRKGSSRVCTRDTLLIPQVSGASPPHSYNQCNTPQASCSSWCHQSPCCPTGDAICYSTGYLLLVLCCSCSDNSGDKGENGVFYIQWLYYSLYKCCWWSYIGELTQLYTEVMYSQLMSW